VQRLIPHVKLPIIVPPKTAADAPLKRPTAFRSSVNEDSQALGDFLGGLDNQQASVDAFVKTILSCQSGKGRVYFTGVGKSAIVAHRAAASLVSVGFVAEAVDSVDWLHGGLGRIVRGQNNVVVMITYSGKTPELLSALPHLKARGVKLLSIVGRTDSHIYAESDATVVTEIKEVCLCV
jgi:arabinose-5-phosphate isomerase